MPIDSLIDSFYRFRIRLQNRFQGSPRQKWVGIRFGIVLNVALSRPCVLRGTTKVRIRDNPEKEKPKG